METIMNDFVGSLVEIEKNLKLFKEIDVECGVGCVTLPNGYRYITIDDCRNWGIGGTQDSPCNLDIFQTGGYMSCKGSWMYQDFAEPILEEAIKAGAKVSYYPFPEGKDQFEK